MLKSLILASALILSGIVPALITPPFSQASLAYTRVRVEAVDTATPSLKHPREMCGPSKPSRLTSCGTYTRVTPVAWR